MKKSKKCKTCGERKPIKDFGHHHKTADGYNPHCRVCIGQFATSRPPTS